MTEQQQPLGLSGRLADLFKQNQITPLLALVGFLLGLFAVLVTPREEEPQIEVTFANVFIPYQGASAAMVERQVAIPAEKIVAEIAGIEHIYSISEPGMALLTVQFTVGEDRTEALVRLYNAFYANADWQPQDAGIGPVLIKPKGIDDVPVFALTLWSRNPDRSSADLLAAAKGLEEQLQRTNGSRDIYTLGGSQPRVLVRFDSARLHTYGLDLGSIQQALLLSNQVQQSSGLLQADSEIQLHTGVWLRSAEQVGELIVAVRQQDGSAMPVYLRDVATVSFASGEPQHYVQHWQRDANGSLLQSPAVTLYVAKQPGTNAVDVTQALQAQLAQLQQQYIADDIELTVSRNYGETAEDKANTLIQKLVFATISVVVLVGFALGWREAFVVGMAVVITLALTLFASWAYGFTLNRVSLFALIFSIGILVDDAIVVVENLHRHMLMGKKSLLEAIPHAVEEVGAPTILATFTVIAALLPMAFVSGLMGPYMSPIPLNASMGMLISLLVAFIFTPWLFYRVFINHQSHSDATAHDDNGGRAETLFRRLMSPFLAAAAGRGNRIKLLVSLLVLIAGSVLLVVNQNVVLKMLPFDNKSEFQVVVDLPEGSTLEQTQAVLNQISTIMLAEPEVTHVQTYAGTAAPINFNGLVRQYYLRQYPWQGDVQVNLAHRLDRDEQSHAIALRVRPALQALEQQTGYSIKLVEVPPGPPVLAPLVAEVYGPDYAQQLAAAEQFKAVFAGAEQVVDIDSTIEAPQALWQLRVDQQKAAEYGVSVAAINQAIAIAIDGQNGGYLREPSSYQLIPIELKLQSADSANWQALGQLPVMSQAGELIALSELTYRVDGVRENAIHRKDLRPVVYVTADLAGGVDSPLYGMIDIHAQLAQQGVAQNLIAAPNNTDEISVKWDGEWQITYETFRDMGLAYGVGLIMIYLLVVAQFHSYGVPLIIMAPIPLTLIGIMPGHWLLGAQFTATSMIGMIALAGIIVRNSILLVDYIQQQTALGVKLETAVIHASAVRARPIILTALAAMMGGFFILDDPIFGGLAVSLIFGILVSTLLTLVVIPVVYYAYNYRKYVS
ncbi:MAG: Toluene efflux pump membrane transporter TtgB [Pseudidiomarina mangrovi]|nr:MAG: Toluene efflux pump membrane transporter TtgB [Pseudidiomarina mangrovi]